MLLKDIVEANHYSFVDSFDSWQDSIYGAAQPMVADGTLDNQYLDKIIENVKKCLTIDTIRSDKPKILVLHQLIISIYQFF